MPSLDLSKSSLGCGSKRYKGKIHGDGSFVSYTLTISLKISGYDCLKVVDLFLLTLYVMSLSTFLSDDL